MVVYLVEEIVGKFDIKVVEECEWLIDFFKKYFC